jgi:hypothetical protein
MPKKEGRVERGALRVEIEACHLQLTTGVLINHRFFLNAKSTSQNENYGNIKKITLLLPSEPFPLRFFQGGVAGKADLRIYYATNRPAGVVVENFIIQNSLFLVLKSKFNVLFIQPLQCCYPVF